MKTTRGFVFAVLTFTSLAGACGGGSKSANPPMTGDDKNDTNWGDGEGGVSASSGDGGAGAGTGDGVATGGDDRPLTDGPSGTEDGAKALLKQFTDPKADHAALSKSLRPAPADYKALFDDATAVKMEAAYAKEWDSGKMIIKPKNEKQTEVKLWGATGAELAAGTGHAKEFPGGYKKIAKHLSPAVTFYAFKFVEPKKDSGMAYDGLAYVNGHWVITPKPWHVEGGAGGDDKPVSAPHEKPPGKAHPKKKKK